MNPLVELQARQDEIRARLLEIEEAHAEEVLPDDIQTEHDELNEEFAGNDRQIAHFEERRARLATVVRDDDRRQTVGMISPSKGENIYDLSTVRANQHASPEAYGRELRDRAMRAVESSRFGTDNREAAQDRVSWLLENRDTDDGVLARRILQTGSPAYQRAFGKKLLGKELSSEEARALSVGTDTEGGFAVPFTLDPTVILTSDGSVNPLRQIARVESIVGSNTWQGVTSAGITVSRAAEGSEVDDDAPAIAQPEVTVQRVDGFVPFSVEAGQDWGALQSEITMMLQEAKDDEEATSFVTGDGTGTNAGGIIGTLDSGQLVDIASTGSFAVSDLYALEEALGDRFLARGRFMANRAIYNVIRQLDTSGGADLWVRLGAGLPPELIGYPAHVSSAQSSTFAADDGLLLGDFRHFLIVDRVGMNVELVPHLFGANNRPTGERGILAIWRNNSVILADEAFVLLSDDGV